MKRPLVSLLLSLLVLQIADSSTKVRVSPVRYENPLSSISLTGDCCDGVLLANNECTDKCDTEVVLCLDNTTRAVDDMSTCTLGTYATTPLDNMDVFDFPNTTGSFFFKIDTIVPNIMLKIAAYDMDTDAAILIDNYAYNLSLIKPARRIEEAIVQRIELLGTRDPDFGVTRFIFNLSVFCENGWYGPTCSVNCVANDDCFNHYSCDPFTGAKVCRAGWSVPELNCNVRDTSVELLKCQRDDLCNHQGDCYSFGPNVADFYCCCFPGFKGRDCTSLTACNYSSVPCMNNGTCKQLSPVAAKCTCPLGYVGTTCETKLEPCLNNSCKNGATCVPNLVTNTYTCQCPAGYNGSFCEFPHPCYSQPCFNGGGCTENGTSYRCTCPQGYSGSNCQTDVDECSVLPCSNGGRCAQVTPPPAMGPLFTCTCTGGFEGSLCEIPHPCYNQPCLHGGVCTENGANYACTCLRGYAGLSCEIDINECSPTPCMNGGMCIEVVPPHTTGELFICMCTGGFNGTLCENPHPCFSQPCQHGGTCFEKDTSYNCTCPRGYTGPSCEIDIDDCSPMPCQNGGSCTQITPPPQFGLMFSCNCPRGYEGLRCQTDSNECSSAPCQNGGICVEVTPPPASGPLLTCNCPRVFNGTFCEIPRPCVSQPCLYGGSCNENGANYTCTCSRGYAGLSCENDIDECSSKPCQNGGTCTQLTPSASTPLYLCSCQLGFNGTNCAGKTDWCAVNPCANNGVCVSASPPVINGTLYNCTCPRPWTGANCTKREDPCVSNPCQNGGNCSSNQSLNFTCACANGWTGSACEATSSPANIEINANRSNVSRSGLALDLYVIIGICIAAVILILSISAFVWHTVQRRRRIQRGVFDGERKVFDDPPPLDDKPISTMTTPPIYTSTQQEGWF